MLPVVQELEDGTNIIFGSSRNGYTDYLQDDFRFNSSNSDFMSLSWSEKHSQLIAWRTKFHYQRCLRGSSGSQKESCAIVSMMVPEDAADRIPGGEVTAGT